MRAVDFLAGLADAGLETFGVADLSRLFGLGPARARGVAWMLHDRGYTQRLKRNVYAVRPVQDWGKDLSLPAVGGLAAALAVAPEPSFVAYYSAMEVHRMTQHPLRSAFIAVRRQTRARSIGPLRIRFVTLSEHRFFGFAPTRVAGDVLAVAGLERTILDGLDRPELCGGIEEVYRGMVRRVGDIDGEVLSESLVKMSSPIVTKRFGLLAELAGADPDVIGRAESLARRTKTYGPLDPMRPVTAESVRYSKWELAVNVPLDRLRASAET